MISINIDGNLRTSRFISFIDVIFTKFMDKIQDFF